ncbi:MAG: histidine kinase [Crocinitomicaceae bacterium]|nr:histidine kinase [Crocinitomicaceae bacterium]
MCFGQNPTHFIIGEDEFTNTDIYSLLYNDQTEILYIGTNDGLYAYKQNRIIQFQAIDGQLGNSFFDLRLNRKGEIFCSNLNGQIFKITNGKLSLFNQIDPDENVQLFKYFIDDRDRIITVTKSTVRSIDAKGKESIILDVSTNPIAVLPEMEEFPKATLLCKQAFDGELYITFGNSMKVLRWKDGKLDLVSNSLDFNYTGRVNYFDINAKTFGLIEEENRIVNIDHTLILGTDLKFKERFLILNDSELIGLDIKHGARILELKNDSLIEKQRLFQNEFISTAYSNINGTLFLGTFGSGIIVSPNKNVIQHHSEGLLLGIESTPTNEVYLSTRLGEVFEFKKEKKLIDKVKANVDGVFYIPGNFSFSAISQKHLLYETYSEDYVGIKDVCMVDSNNMLISGLNGIYLLTTTSNSDQVKSRCISKQGRSTAITWSPSDELVYFTTNLGILCQPLENSYTDASEEVLYEGKQFIANDLVSFNDKLYCATNEHGILVFENKKWVDRISVRNGLKSNNIKKIMLQGSTLYILGSRGMQIFDLETRRINYLGIAEGVLTADVTDFTLSDDKLWLLEQHNFYSIDISKTREQKLISKLYIDSIIVNGHVIDGKSQVQFNYNENKFSFYFDYRNIESKSETTIQYTLDGFYDEWKNLESTENVIEFQSLPVGNYTFKIKASYRNQETEVFEYSFSILPPYWRTWWFYCLIAFTIGLTVLLLTRYRYRLIQKKNREILEKQQLKTSLLDSELKALRSQMNPHFIFNSLNSIQGLILEQKTDASYDYIVLFANLVRSTLNYSNKDFISIQNEIEFLETYLKLEKLRFGDDFSFEISYEGDNELSVPSLIVQPFIENALLHGLMHKRGGKKISITFEFTDQLKCIIIDNGVGRQKAEEIQIRQGREHESFALDAIKNRLEILSIKNGVDAYFNTIDLFENGIPSGTRIEVVIPHKASF